MFYILIVWMNIGSFPPTLNDRYLFWNEKIKVKECFARLVCIAIFRSVHILCRVFLKIDGRVTYALTSPHNRLPWGKLNVKGSRLPDHEGNTLRGFLIVWGKSIEIMGQKSYWRKLAIWTLSIVQGNYILNYLRNGIPWLCRKGSAFEFPLMMTC